MMKHEDTRTWKNHITTKSDRRNSSHGIKRKTKFKMFLWQRNSQKFSWYENSMLKWRYILCDFLSSSPNFCSLSFYIIYKCTILYPFSPLLSIINFNDIFWISLYINISVNYSFFSNMNSAVSCRCYHLFIIFYFSVHYILFVVKILHISWPFFQ